MKNTYTDDKFYDFNNIHNHHNAISYLESVGSDCKGEIALWKSVITQALLDATIQQNDIQSKAIRHKAKAWFNITNKDFIQICEMANLEPSIIQKKALQTIKYYNRKHHRPGFKKRHSETNNIPKHLELSEVL